MSIKVCKVVIFKFFLESTISMKILTKRIPLKLNLISNFMKDYLLVLKTLSKKHTKYKIKILWTNKSYWGSNKTEKQLKFLFEELSKLNNIGKSFLKNFKFKTKLINWKTFTVGVMEVNNVSYVCVSRLIQL